jgi:hypothetical protein
MEKRESKVSFAKAGNGVGSKVTLPMPWLKKMNVSPIEKDIELFFNEETKEIIIRKRN